jgi:hypothetical protein
MKLFSTRFNVPIEDIRGNMQMEIVDLQCSSVLKGKYNNVGLVHFYSKCIDKNTSPANHSNTLKMVSLFGRNYLCECLMSRMKDVESK